MRASQSESGFTLVELLVVIIIVGILSAIALPSFLNQANKAKQSEAKTYIGAVNGAQQAYRIEKPTFASTLSDLEIGIPEVTPDYRYTLGEATSTSTTIIASTEDGSLKEYSGGIVVMQESGQTSTAACQTKQTSSASEAIPPSLSPSTGAGCVGNMEIMR